MASDPLIWEQHPEPTRCEEATFRRFFSEGLASGGALVALARLDGRIIGSSRFDHYDPDARVVEIGWTFLARACWGGRYNGEMKRLMLEHAFSAVDRVLFVIGANNVRSQRAVEKLGAVPAGSRVDSRLGESLVYELTAEHYAAAERSV